jgi:hypothetical protein
MVEEHRGHLTLLKISKIQLKIQEATENFKPSQPLLPHLKFIKNHAFLAALFWFGNNTALHILYNKHQAPQQEAG